MRSLIFHALILAMSLCIFTSKSDEIVEPVPNDVAPITEIVCSELPIITFENEPAYELVPLSVDVSEPVKFEYADRVWKRLKDEGYSDQAAAGILGNMMAEVGGQTLDLNPTLYNADGSCYGLCQWSKQFYSDVYGRDFEHQLDFLLETIDDQFAYCGEIYGCTLDDFKNHWNEVEAALKFAQIYERCDSASYYVRQKNATAAYLYFTDQGDI